MRSRATNAPSRSKPLNLQENIHSTAVNLWSRFATPSTALPQHQARASMTQTSSWTKGKCHGASHNYLLCCIPHSKFAAKAHHLDVCKIPSDQAFFPILRKQYHSARGIFRSWVSLKKLSSIRFVQVSFTKCSQSMCPADRIPSVKFDMYCSTLVDIRKVDDIPPESCRNEYAYDPMPAETIPPIGPNLLMHLCEHPEDAEPTPVLFQRLPRRLRCRLEACPQRGWRQGWGMQFVEGANWLKVFACGLIAFSVSLIFGIIWAILRDDVKGGVGIAGVVLSFGLFTVGTIQAALLM